ncbi:hypothetical protein [Winogradskyella sp.]|uniref:hypothetical protein n=1 Tax=Winogradskyella sp. TaxID=1883156 RepID=UPI003BAAF0E4
MKLKITLILLFVAFGINAQKQLQPYNYSVTKDDKTETILIYASAEDPKSITFTLKNEKNETLKTKGENDEDKDITFKVFPFTENSFRRHLVDAINSIVDMDESKKEYEIFKSILAPLKNTDEEKKEDEEKSNEKLATQLNKRNEAIQNVRNIYQFFNALVVTAFEYDTEPVAGILKYNDMVTITKKTINGLDTDDYFDRQSKIIRKLIYSYEEQSKGTFFQGSDKPIKLKLTGKYATINLDEFMNFLSKEHCEPEKVNHRLTRDNKEPEDIYSKISKNCSVAALKKEDKNYKEENNPNTTTSTCPDPNQNNITGDEITVYKKSFLGEFVQYYQNLKKGKRRRARVLFKKHIAKKIKQLYNIYEFSNFAEGNGNESFANQYIKLKNYKIANEKCHKSLSKEIDSYKELISNRNSEIENYEKQKTAIENDIAENKKEMDILKAENKRINANSISYLSKKEDKYAKSKALIEDKIQFNQTYINTLKSYIENKESDKSFFSSRMRSYQNKINFFLADNHSKLTKVPLWDFKVSNIEIDINSGFIEHITVTGEIILPSIDKIALVNSIRDYRKKYYRDISLDTAIIYFYDEPYVKELLKNVLGKELKFENEFPIGFSSKTDFADLDNYDLYAFEGSEKVFSLPLTNVIELYIQRHQNDRLDFSPKNQVVKLPLHDPNDEKQVELKKEKSSKILNAKVFTDFNGFKENEPNGLVQFEVEKQVPLWTKRMPLGTGRSSNVGFANYAIFNLTWAKLNEEDRELQVLKTESFVNNEPQTDNYITYLDLIRFENVSVGVDLNIASFDFPLIKTRVELNGGVHYGRVKVVDDVPNPTDENAEATIRQLEKDVNMIRLYPDVIVRIRPEERFGAYLRFRPFRTIVPDNEEFFTVYSADNFLDDPNGRQSALEDQRWLQRYELGAFYTPSADSDNKFFFRYRYTNTSEWETNGYSEIQVGYQIYLKF